MCLGKAVSKCYLLLLWQDSFSYYNRFPHLPGGRGCPSKRPDSFLPFFPPVTLWTSFAVGLASQTGSDGREGMPLALSIWRRLSKSKRQSSHRCRSCSASPCAHRAVICRAAGCGRKARAPRCEVHLWIRGEHGEEVTAEIFTAHNQHGLRWVREVQLCADNFMCKRNFAGTAATTE